MEFDDPNYVIRVCYACTTAQSTKWRTGPMGPKTLCNACGIRYWKEKRAMEVREHEAQANANVGSNAVQVQANANVRVGAYAKGKGRKGGGKGRYKALKIRASDPY